MRTKGVIKYKFENCHAIEWDMDEASMDFGLWLWAGCKLWRIFIIIKIFIIIRYQIKISQNLSSFQYLWFNIYYNNIS